MAYFVVDNSADKIHLTRFNEFFESVDTPEDAEAIVVFGGDGSMLSAIKAYMAVDKPFIGVNAGTRGHLMNDVPSHEQLYQRWGEVVFEDLWLIQANVTTTTSQLEIFGFNDIWVERLTGQILRMELTFDNEKQPPLMVGDGVLFSTPQGSTGYNLALRGKAISPGVQVLQVAPMSCVIDKTPVGSLILPDDVEVKVDFLQIEKRPGVVCYDGVKASDDAVKSITVKKSNQTVRLGFIPEYAFIRKVLSWQLQY
ncbi:MAG: NAD(+)/NADH kinase [Methylococcales bacterium]|nr:NAD(+)/NADH kinase [Methylococcales bacterium]MBT7443337.1 NAD(+)/NADH kinase [Methylococcales bacterium]